MVVQSDLFEEMRTRVVVPLLPPAMLDGGKTQSLNPALAVGGEVLVLVPQLMATLTRPELGERVGSLAPERDTITRAIDALLSGV